MVAFNIEVGRGLPAAFNRERISLDTNQANRDALDAIAFNRRTSRY